MSDQRKYISKLEGARVLIIGGSSGIGYAVAEACIEHGCTVIISASSPATSENALKKLHVAYPSFTSRIYALFCDLGDENKQEDNVKVLFDQASKFGKLDHIVYTAGNAVFPTSLADLTLSTIKQTGIVRFYGALQVAKYAATHLNPGPKSSLTLTSGSLFQRPLARWIAIASFESGLLGMTRALAVEMRPVRVNIVVPGPVDTPLWRMSEEQAKEHKEVLKARTATGRVGTAEDVAEAYVGLMKDWNCTGSVVETNSGELIM